MYDNLTESDIDKIKKEIEHRKLVVRPEAIKAVQEARAQGDLSENFEYYAAKREKNANESRIRYLENMLKTAQVIEHEYAGDEVGMNSEVVLFNEKTGREMTVRIVTTIRTNPLIRLVSGFLSRLTTEIPTSWKSVPSARPWTIPTTRSASINPDPRACPQIP